jgi:hypothetical protein
MKMEPPLTIYSVAMTHQERGSTKMTLDLHTFADPGVKMLPDHQAEAKALTVIRRDWPVAKLGPYSKWMLIGTTLSTVVIEE